MAHGWKGATAPNQQSCLQTQLSLCSPSFYECCQKEPWEKVTAVLHSGLQVCAWYMWVDSTSHTKYKQCRTRNNQLSTGISSELRQLQRSPQYYMSDSCNKFCQGAHHTHICVWETMCIFFKPSTVFPPYVPSGDSWNLTHLWHSFSHFKWFGLSQWMSSLNYGPCNFAAGLYCTGA